MRPPLSECRTIAVWTGGNGSASRNLARPDTGSASRILAKIAIPVRSVFGRHIEEPTPASQRPVELPPEFRFATMVDRRTMKRNCKFDARPARRFPGLAGGQVILLRRPFAEFLTEYRVGQFGT